MLEESCYRSYIPDDPQLKRMTIMKPQPLQMLGYNVLMKV